MSGEVVEEILARAMEDDAFRAQLLRAPIEALKGYALTTEERDAFVLGDLRALLATHVGRPGQD